MLYGANSVTSDCDLAFEKSTENLKRMAAALKELGARPVRASEDGEFELDFSILLAPFMHLKTEVGPVDLINRLPNIGSFQELYDRALILEVDGVEIRIAAIEDLIRLKSDSTRERDALHISMLKTILEQQG